MFVEGTEKSQGFETYARSLFVQDVKGKNKVMKDIHVVKIAENLTAQDKTCNKDISPGECVVAN